jgi:hypothetical protein
LCKRKFACIVDGKSLIKIAVVSGKLLYLLE